MKIPLSTDPPIPEPRELRRMVCGDHQNLREQITAVVELLDTEHVEGHGDAYARARPMLERFAEQLFAHMALEDTYMVPLLREDFAWGEMRARGVLAHHAEQRRTLNRLVDRLHRAGEAREGLVEDFRSFLTELELDMGEEERALLGPEVLGDSIVHVEAGA